MPQAQVPSKISVDFSNVEDRREGGSAAHVPEGDYLLKVVGCELKDNKDKTSKYLSWRCQITEPSKYRSAGSVWHTTSLKPEALWNLRNFMEDLGLNVPKKAVDIPIAAIVKKQLVFGATLADDEYNGKIKSKIAATFKKDAFEGASGEATEDDDEEATTDSDDEDVDELDVDDL